LPQNSEFHAKDVRVENTQAAGRAEADSTLLHEFWQSLKYTTIQQPCDGVTQAINHFGGNIAARTFVEAPRETEFGSADWVAQQAGAGLAKIAGIMVLHKGISFGAAALTRTATSLTLAESVAGKVSLGSLSVSGGLYEGIFSKSRENSFWKDRIANSTVGGLTMYAMGKTQLGLQGATGLSRMSPEGFTGIAGRQLANSLTGFISGATGGAVGVEVGSLMKQGKFASKQELGEAMLTSGVGGATFGLVTKPMALAENIGAHHGGNLARRTGALKSVELKSVSAEQPVLRSQGIPHFAQLAGEGTIVPAKTMTFSATPELLQVLNKTKTGKFELEPPPAVGPVAEVTAAKLPQKKVLTKPQA